MGPQRPSSFDRAGVGAEETFISDGFDVDTVLVESESVCLGIDVGRAELLECVHAANIIREANVRKACWGSIRDLVSNYFPYTARVVSRWVVDIQRQLRCAQLRD